MRISHHNSIEAKERVATLCRLVPLNGKVKRVDPRFRLEDFCFCGNAFILWAKPGQPNGVGKKWKGSGKMERS